jgi:hypothetical protein
MGKLDPPKIHPSFSQASTLGKNENVARKGRDETEPADVRNYPQTIMPPNGRLPRR